MAKDPVYRRTRALAALVAGLSASLLIPPQRGWRGALLTLPKVVAEGFAFVLALLGGTVGLRGLKRRRLDVALLGLAGAAVAARHVRRVTASQDAAFAEAFGADWAARIPKPLRQRRFSPLPQPLPAACWQRDLAIDIHAETGDPLLADLWQPPEGVPPSGVGVVFVHGSGWFATDKDYGTRPFFRRLAGQGHVVLDVAYTLAPKARLRGMLADVRRAVAWLKAHAAELGIDPQRVVLVGESAGGHLALLAAYTPQHPELTPDDVTADTSVRAVVGYYSVPDLRAFHETIRQNLAGVELPAPLGPWLTPWLRRIRFLPPYGELIPLDQMVVAVLGGTPDEKPELCALGSPIHHVGPDCPPTLLIQGGHDPGGMAPDMLRLHRALRAAGVPSAHLLYPNVGHAFDLSLPRWSPAAQAATYDVERFLGWVAGLP